MTSQMFYAYAALIAAIIERGFAIWATMHAVLIKRETSSVIGWVGLIWFSPFLGTVAYFLFGVNRIERKGRDILKEIKLTAAQSSKRALRECPLDPETFPYNQMLANVGNEVTRRDLLPGNQVIPLIGGETAYHAMLTAISTAESTISFCSYIFDYDKAGKMFIEALVEAQNRGVDVRILIDHLGSRYSKPTSITAMRERGLNVQVFLPTYVPLLVTYANLRNHRKIMVVDGLTGFTGGMNIREGCLNEPGHPHPVQDIHFRFDGPVVQHFQEVFLADWAFVTNEELSGEKWFGQAVENGPVWARGISDGPDADLDHIRLVILGAIATARESIDIVTPYFLPDTSLTNALKIAKMRGIRVRVILPQKVNIRAVQWASMDPISRLLERNIEIYQTPLPFDHTKIMLVDHDWSLVGSSNWDPRSLRLNFEFNVECFGTELNEQLKQLVDAKIASAKPLTLEDLAARSPFEKVRDGVSRLVSPYL